MENVIENNDKDVSMEKTEAIEEIKSPEVDENAHKSPKSTSTPTTKTASKSKKRKSEDTQNSSQSSSKNKKIKDANAPKYPKTGYVRFVKDRRDEIKKECPELTVIEVTKKMADEWNSMCEEKKKPYLDAAELDKERFKAETEEYNKKLKISEKAEKKPPKPKKDISFDEESSIDLSPTKPSNDQSKNRKNAIKVTRPSILTTPPPSPPLKENIPRNGEIPIFTDEFLQHNRVIDSELKKIRRINTDYEQQNSVLEKHVENMQNGIAKSKNDIDDLQEENRLLETYLTKLREKLTTAFAGHAIPTELSGATIENIDKYMDDLHEMVKANSHGPASLNKAKDIIRKLDLNSIQNDLK